MEMTTLHSGGRQRAESLWEVLGHCLCTGLPVRHWCERCQDRIHLIEGALAHERRLALAAGVSVEDALALRHTRDEDEE